MSQEQPYKKGNQGFANLSPEKRKEIARKGGEAVSRNREHMSIIGRKGGEASGAKKRSTVSQ